MQKPRGVSVIGIAFVASIALTAQRSASTQQAISRVENGLLPPVIVTGRPLEPKPLADRMRELKVPGVSVAVFRDGRIEWTREWGLADVESRRKVDRETRFQAARASARSSSATAIGRRGSR